MRIALVEPYCTGSHAAWAHELARHSSHQVDLLTLPGRHWKWRMHGGAVTLAQRFLALPETPDLILASDMLDLTTFLALTRSRSSACRCALYFHENQLTYPWSTDDRDPLLKRDLHYAFINYASALAADAVLFNSSYHREAFLSALPGFLAGFPDANENESVARIAAKSEVLHLGLELARLDEHRPESPEPGAPLILWNHRWEYDKDPDAFFSALFGLADEGLEFRVAVLGEGFGKAPGVFERARKRLGARVVQWGYLESFDEYARWLWRADILPVTSRQEFFGASVVQAMYCGCAPLLPERLAYPEHVPPGFEGQVLYRDQEELVSRLRELLLKGGAAGPSLREHAARYCWRELAPVYDRALEQIAVGAGLAP